MAEAWSEEPLSVFVFGASGDLAKKKTYPALFDLFVEKLLPSKTIICGYARSDMTKQALQAQIKPYIQKASPNEEVLQGFLDILEYKHGQYGSEKDVKVVSEFVTEAQGNPNVENRIFYFALPPDVFIPTAAALKKAGLSSKGFNRVIVEKPFGHDTKSAQAMSKALGDIFTEDHLYRIDHYLGKELVQALMNLRFANAWLEPLMNSDYVEAVTLSFKEDIGTEGRGGYFDKSGIIRDIMQNHLMQVLSLIAMEPPSKLTGESASDLIRDEKVKVLKAIKPWKAKNTVLGQYIGYLDDETVPKGSKCPTFASTVMKIETKRWKGVPFIMSAGKALDERKCEVRIILKTPENASNLFDSVIVSNEVVIRIQPDPEIYMTFNVKQPGLSSQITQSRMNLNLGQAYPGVGIPEAYTRLILDVMKGRQENFVRQDELIQAWKIVTPLLDEIDGGKLEPSLYKFGSAGPDAFAKQIRSYCKNLDFEGTKLFVKSKH